MVVKLVVPGVDTSSEMRISCRSSVSMHAKGEGPAAVLMCRPSAAGTHFSAGTAAEAGIACALAPLIMRHTPLITAAAASAAARPAHGQVLADQAEQVAWSGERGARSGDGCRPLSLLSQPRVRSIRRGSHPTTASAGARDPLRLQTHRIISPSGIHALSGAYIPMSAVTRKRVSAAASSAAGGVTNESSALQPVACGAT